MRWPAGARQAEPSRSPWRTQPAVAARCSSSCVVSLVSPHLCCWAAAGRGKLRCFVLEFSGGGPCRSLVGVDEWFPGLP